MANKKTRGGLKMLMPLNIATAANRPAKLRLSNCGAEAQGGAAWFFARVRTCLFTRLPPFFCIAQTVAICNRFFCV